MRDLKIAYGNFRNAAFWSNKTITFDELCDRLKEPIRTSESAEEYPKLTKAQRDEIKDKGEWKKGLQYNKRTGKIENNLHNISLIMENDSYMKHIVFNQLADGMEIVGEVPWDHPSKFWRDADDAQLCRQKLTSISSIGKMCSG